MQTKEKLELGWKYLSTILLFVLELCLFAQIMENL